MSETLNFQTEVSRLLDIVANALYSNREIFLRELISNASDACDRRRYEAISNPALSGRYEISLATDTTARTLTIKDSGIGMNREDLIKNLGTIAHSGTRALAAGLEGDAKKDMNLIGQFGVGFYSAFMVADKVVVTTRKAGEEKAWQWISDGKGSFTIDEALKDEPGTSIVLHLKDDAGEFLLEDMLKAVIKKYSDHISFPILIEDQVINKASALWTRPKSEITEQEYKEFYHHVSGAVTTEEPFLTLHWKGEGAIEHHNLLFIPNARPFDLYDPRRLHGLKLYVRRVFIADGVEGLLPPFLRFVKGVVDSEDLPLNISREMLQSNPLVTRMSGAITRKILGELQEIAKSDPEKFEAFWKNFGAVVKEGLYDAHAFREPLTKVVRFYSTQGAGLTGLEDYVSRMKPEQEFIYYIAGSDRESLQNSPQLEAFRAKGVEVLFMTDAIDEFWLPMQESFADKKFKSVTRGSADLSVLGEPEKEMEAKDENEKSADLLACLKKVLKGEVVDVTLSQRLVDSPVCLVAAEGDVDINMQRLLKKQQGYDAANRYVLEINPRHPLIVRLSQAAATQADNSDVEDAAWLLLDQARILEGEALKNPAEFSKRMSRAIEKGLLS